MTNEKIGTMKGKEIMILKRAQLLSNLLKFLIITSPTSYSNNILYFFSTHEFGFVSVPRKERK